MLGNGPPTSGIGRVLLTPPTRCVLIFLGVSGLVGCHQPRPAFDDRLVIGEVVQRSEFAANLRALCLPGGRLTGTPNAEQAADFVAAKLRAYGLQNVHFEPFDMSCWTVRRTRVTVLDEPPREIEGAIALARTQPTPPGGITTELIDLGDGSDEDFTARGPELAGKFVLLNAGESRGPRVKLACAHGAAGVVFLSRPERPPIIGNGHTTPRPEPVVVIPHDPNLPARLAAGETLRLNIQLDTENWACRPRNVVGEIPGRGPRAREIVLICAHLDSWHLAEGGMDNGSGSATILETARALGRLGWQPRRTVRFVWFMAEELGLEGSEAYVRQHADELENVIAVINLDMPGAPRNLAYNGNAVVEPFLKRLVADLAACELSPEIGHWTGGNGSDYAPFAQRGVCALTIGGELGPGVKHYHTAGDTYDTVDRRGTVQSSAVLGVLVRRLADEPQRPTRPAAAATGEAGNR